ncbi:alginate export family protein [Burkholderia cenocepacia]|uniref:Alginate export family protein n=1 Tax=Burkholderia cenocepacia TaxID=95486 RepID=A0ABD4UKP7_9BURK|nr:alginate export family protein [Burkholderia cenocepacia]MCW3698925.1 alginate export family protein [Burkholderia cenocepacia]MCW3706543.1 alginate export family protein [Burkholderia cenocepacia]MCW3714966.1 alginate export family protein [Burkholderia cenocepacia]MCW3722718.1 alginate export family protein [Burkholderia cenocepacia]MCW3729772.1 alginate export family protein [Burkholderia cenocepacia]
MNFMGKICNSIRFSNRRGICTFLLVGAWAANAYADPDYRLFRYDEDYRYLAEPGADQDSWDSIKYVPLGGATWYASFGGEARERYEGYSASNFGVPRGGPDYYLLHRVLVHADIHAGEHARLFFQLGSHLTTGRDFSAPPYRDRLDIQQAFFDFRLPADRSDVLDSTVRIGRQEMAFGAQRVVAVRDAPNVRRTFDGIRVIEKFHGGQLDLFVTKPVLLEDGIFDDHPSNAQQFWGGYLTIPGSIIPYSNTDLYYLGLHNDAIRLGSASGEEHRHSVGMRVYGKVGAWDWDWEWLGQAGTLGTQRIRAWGGSTEMGYSTVVLGSKVRGGIKFTATSGDHDLHDHTAGTYNPLFPKLAYFNQAGLLGGSNIIDIQPSITTSIAHNIQVTTAVDVVWRNSINDAIYTASGTPIPNTAGRSGKLSSIQTLVDVTWRASRHISVNGGFVYVNVAPILRALDGHNVIFTYLSGSYIF